MEAKVLELGEQVKQAKRYQLLYNCSPNMVFFLKENGKVEEWNPAVEQQLGFSKGDELYIQNVFRTCLKEVDGRITLLNGNFGTFFETVAYCKNQTCFSVEMGIYTLEGGPDLVCIARNIAIQKETSKELVHAQVEAMEAHKERNEFVANVTHELRTPVNGIMGLTQNLLETELDGEQRESLEIIDQSCHNMIKIINNILDFSKLESGKFTIEDREFDFFEFMDRMVKVNQPQIEEKGLKLLCSVAQDIPRYLMGDELRLTQILNNLLSNAIKFTSAGQIVVDVIQTIEDEETIELFFMVIDSGIGIADEERDKLFRSFSQVDASITRKFGGTGLGLSIVKQLVEMMDGSINVESEKGKGSTFSFSVRLKKAVPQTDRRSDSDENSHMNSKKDAAVSGLGMGIRLGGQSDSMTGSMPEQNSALSGGDFAFRFGGKQEEDGTVDRRYKLGTEENRREIDFYMERLILCIEMENWNKANSFAENVKKLVEEDPMNLKRKAFRLQMTVRKGDHDTAVQEYEDLKAAMDQFFGET